MVIESIGKKTNEYSLTIDLNNDSYSIPNVYDDTYFENRISQLLDFEFKSWDLGLIENNSIVTIRNTQALLDSAPEMIRQMFVEIGGVMNYY